MHLPYPLLSVRSWSERFGPQLRLLVALLALLAFVAPTWHVCSMGGHVMAMGPGNEMAGHLGTASGTNFVHVDRRRALICFCAAKPTHHAEFKGPKLSARMSHGDVNCLALLLQTIPGAVSTPPALFKRSTPITTPIWATPTSSPSFSPLCRFRGRAPPLTL